MSFRQYVRDNGKDMYGFVLNCLKVSTKVEPTIENATLS